MFSNKTAWFSKSCAPDSLKLWAQYGGKLEVSSLAQFIFSDDWDHEDTKIFLKRPEYLEQHLAVFRSSYIEDVIKGGAQKIILGGYLLVPQTIERRLASGIMEDLASTDEDGSSDDESPNGVADQSRRSPLNDKAVADTQNKKSFLPCTSHQVSKKIGTGSATPSSVPNNAGSKGSAIRVILDKGSETHKLDRKATLRSRLNQGAGKISLPLTTKAERKGIEPAADKKDQYVNITHVEDLPKVIGILHTIHSKAAGVEIRYVNCV